jgi:DNA helicase-2/ATP-dependent DNA helicase PcrA
MSDGFDRPFIGGLNKNPETNRPNLRSLNDLHGKLNNSNSVIQDIKVGYNVEHDRFGKGKVTKLEGSGADKKATIFFPHHGSKTVLLRFANLKIIED